MTSSVGLYYPFIHFKDEAWVKVCSLYWDRMKRIVPGGAQLRDSDDIKRLFDAGFVENEDPTEYSAELTEPFRGLLETQGDAITAAFGIDRRDEWHLPPDMLLQAWPGRDPRLAYVFQEKIDHRLINDLDNAGLIMFPEEDPQWIGMHPKIANLFMTSLAEVIAKRAGARPVTDESFDYLSVSGLSMERLAAALFGEANIPIPEADETEIEQAMANLAIAYFIPTAPQDIPMERIVEFRQNHVEHRARFQAAVRKMVAGLDHLKDVTKPGEVEKQLAAEFEKTLKPETLRMKAAMEKAGFDVVDGILTAKTELPPAIDAALSALGVTLGAPVRVLASLALSTIPMFRKRAGEQEQLVEPSPESYLYLMTHKLKPEAVAANTGDDSKLFLPRSRLRYAI